MRAGAPREHSAEKQNIFSQNKNKLGKTLFCAIYRGKVGRVRQVTK